MGSPLTQTTLNQISDEMAKCPNTYRWVRATFTSDRPDDATLQALARAAVPEQANFPVFQRLMLVGNAATPALTRDIASTIQGKYPRLARLLSTVF